MFDGVEIGGERRPGQSVDVVGDKEVGGVSGSVGRGVVVLENSTWRCQKWESMGLQNVLYISLGVKAALDQHQLAPAGVGDCPPHHDAPSTMGRRLINTVLLVALPLSAPHPPPPIAGMQEELGFIAEDDVPPIVDKGPSEVLVGPQPSGLAMAACEDVALQWSVGAQTGTMQPVAYCLGRDAAATRQYPSGL